jgi:hypothetical protein
MRLLLCCGLLAAASCFTAQAGSATSPPDASESLEANCVAGSGFRIGGGDITLSYDTAAFSLKPAQICAWTVRAALAVNAYFGRFPVRRVRIELEPRGGAGMHGGTTWGEADQGKPLIRVRLGSSASAAQLDDDWSMTHEMVHLSVPSVPERSHWLEEGIATYVEPIARVQTGELSAQSIWADMFRGMRKGLPKDGDRGLDNTPTWGRTYWGGALFCLMADVRIRERTGNRKGLQDALRGVLAAGGNIGVNSTVEYMLGLGDKAVGVPLLSELYGQWAAAALPSSDELDTLWQRLGVVADGDGVRLDDSAPLAAVRRAITAPEPP